MKLHTNLTEAEVRECLARAQQAGDVPDDIEFDLFAETGSRSHAHGYDVHLATERRDTRADGKTRPVAAYYGVRGQLRAATYDEWGAFLAEYFAADEDAHARPYKGKDDFHAKTAYAYAQGIAELPADAASTEPTSDAMLPDADRTVGRIDETLAVYQTWHRAHP